MPSEPLSRLITDPQARSTPRNEESRASDVAEPKQIDRAYGERTLSMT
jgi:hypothetical protein